MVKVDFSAEPSDELLPEGFYQVVVADMEEKISKADKPYLLWHLDLLDPAYSGKRLFLITSQQPHALFALKGILKAIDMFEKNVDFDVKDVCGKKLIVEVGQKEREDNGEMANNISKCLPFDGSTPKTTATTGKVPKKKAVSKKSGKPTTKKKSKKKGF